MAEEKKTFYKKAHLAGERKVPKGSLLFDDGSLMLTDNDGVLIADDETPEPNSNQ